MKRFVFSMLISIVALAALFGEYNPPWGGEEVNDLRSPLFLAGGASVVSMESPVSDAVNPAASALQQRTSIDASYVGLTDPTEDGWKGHVANIGASLPTKYGVFSSNVQFLTTSLEDMDLGTSLSWKGSFAKDLFPNLLIGAGITTVAGSADSFDFGLALDLGFLHLPGEWMGLKDFRWGVALQNFGKWYAPVDGRSGFPSAFTPAVGAGFTALRTKDASIGVTGDLSFPSVQNVRFALGGEFTYKEWLSLNASVRLDLRQIVDDDLPTRSPIPAVGITAVFRTDFKEDSSFLSKQGWNRSDVKTRVSAAPLHSGIWAFGLGMNANLGVVDRNPPKINVGYAEPKVISPNLDGVSDSLEFPLEITDERYVMEYRLVISDDKGKVVRLIENKEKRPENETFRGVVDRLLSEKTGIEVPKSLRWDGIGDNGARLPDGRYSFVVEAKDDNGNSAKTESKYFIIDTTPPKIEIQVPRGADLVFSPNDDGNKDTITIVQTGSAEEDWKAEIRDASGRAVRTFEWKNAAPGNVIWDGKGDDGVLLPDGIYSYFIKSKDSAGNETKSGFDNIFISTETTPISLSIDASYFSPNGDGVKDFLTLTPVIPVTNGLESWEMTISDSSDKTMRRFSGLLNAPQPVRFDGRMESGTVLPEGGYRAKLTVTYRNGNRPSATSPDFFVDLTPPRAEIRSDLSVFSPNGDGNKEEITFYQDSSKEERWSGTVKNKDGRTVKTFSWVERAEPSFKWNGTSEAGNLVPDGRYTYQIESMDRAGNRGVSNIVEFAINTEETPVILSADLSAFSPNGDGIKDRIRLTPTVKVNEGIESYKLSVMDSKGTAIRTFTGLGRLDPNYLWDGLAQNGGRAPDGVYFAEVDVIYANGNKAVSRTGAFELDTVPPEISVSVAPKLFSPDGDGRKDAAVFTQKSSRETLWEGRIVGRNNEKVRNYFWKESAADFSWDGLDDFGNHAPDGTYRYIVRAEDRAGNSRQIEIDGIVVDTKKTSAFVTVDSPGFSPNADGNRDEIEFTLYLNLLEGLESWRLQLRDQGGSVRKTFSGTTMKSPQRIQWNGRADAGDVVEGVYTAEFEAVYAKGNQPTAKSSPFVLDVTPPAAKVSLSPIPFSPDNDGIADELRIGLQVTDASPIRDWSFVISDRNGKTFTRFSGNSMPAATILWDGRSSEGELVIAAEDYPYVFTVTDSLGNSRVEKGLIPIDILVIRDGDRLKIKISSITFAPNSPEVIMDETEKGTKNRSVLRRLVEVLSKYENYQVRIEGHANNVSGTEREDREELMPLSLSRAQGVKQALVSMGLSSKRLGVEGKGGKEMLFPGNDMENNWKNRRVEFILVK